MKERILERIAEAFGENASWSTGPKFLDRNGNVHENRCLRVKDENGEDWNVILSKVVVVKAPEN